MKAFLLHSALGFSILAWTPGCKPTTPSTQNTSHGHDHAHAHAHGHEAEAHPPGAIEYSEQSGLHVPAETAREIGLQVAEPEIGVIESEIRFAARVFELRADPVSLTSKPWLSGWITHPQSLSLQEGTPIDAMHQGQRIQGRIAVQRPLGMGPYEDSEVLIELQSLPQGLKTGDFLEIQARSTLTTPITTVPRSALIRSIEGDFVYTANGDHFVRTPVGLGKLGRERAEIREGLYEGDRIVVGGVLALWMTEIESLRGGKACGHVH